MLIKDAVGRLGRGIEIDSKTIRIVGRFSKVDEIFCQISRIANDNTWY